MAVTAGEVDEIEAEIAQREAEFSQDVVEVRVALLPLRSDLTI